MAAIIATEDTETGDVSVFAINVDNNKTLNALFSEMKERFNVGDQRLFEIAFQFDKEDE